MGLYKSAAVKEQLKRDIDKVAIWLHDKYGVDVYIDSDGENDYDHETKLVTISSRTNLYVRLHTLLHEAGHVVLRSDPWTYRCWYSKSGMSSRSWSLHHRVDVVREEVAAWDIGSEIAEDLGIRLEIERYLEHSRKALLTYIKWVTRPRSFIVDR